MMLRFLALATAATFMSTKAYASTITQFFDILVTSNNALDASADSLAHLGSTGTGSITYESGLPFDFFFANNFSFTMNFDGSVQTFTNADSPFGGAAGLLDGTGARVTEIFFDVLDDDFVNNRLDIIYALGIVDFSTISTVLDANGDVSVVNVEVQTVGIPAVQLPASLSLVLFGLGALGLVRRFTRIN